MSCRQGVRKLLVQIHARAAPRLQQRAPRTRACVHACAEGARVAGKGREERAYTRRKVQGSDGKTVKPLRSPAERCRRMHPPPAHTHTCGHGRAPGGCTWRAAHLLEGAAVEDLEARGGAHREAALVLVEADVEHLVRRRGRQIDPTGPHRVPCPGPGLSRTSSALQPPSLAAPGALVSRARAEYCQELFFNKKNKVCNGSDKGPTRRGDGGRVRGARRGSGAGGRGALMTARRQPAPVEPPRAPGAGL